MPNGRCVAIQMKSQQMSIFIERCLQNAPRPSSLLLTPEYLFFTLHMSARPHHLEPQFAHLACEIASLFSTTDGDALDRCPDTEAGAEEAIVAAIRRKQALLGVDYLDIFLLYDFSA